MRRWLGAAGASREKRSEILAYNLAKFNCSFSWPPVQWIVHIFSLNPGCRYYQRFRVCKKHSAQSEVDVEGVTSRFCQQCCAFQPLTAFDGNRRCANPLCIYSNASQTLLFTFLASHLFEFIIMYLVDIVLTLCSNAPRPERAKARSIRYCSNEPERPKERRAWFK